MTYLANTAEYVVEYDGGTIPVLTITRKSDSRSIMLTAKGIAGVFRGCLKTHTPEKVIQTFIRIGGPSLEWQQIYKPGRYPRPEPWERIG